MNHQTPLSMLPCPPASECPSCGAAAVTTSYEDETFVHGKGKNAQEIRAKVPVHSCADCEFIFYDHKSEAARHKALCRHLGLLFPQEIQAIREEFGYTRAEFARLTKIGEASLARWETGVLLQNKALDQYLRLLRYSENIARVCDPSKDDANAAVALQEPTQGWQMRTLKPTQRHREAAASFDL